MSELQCSHPTPPDHLAIVLRKLQEVFDVCDEDCDGWIRVEHFVDLGSQFGRGEEVKRLAKQLDPHSNGRINFKDFCHGVLAINAFMIIAIPPPLPLGQCGEESRARPIIMCTRASADTTTEGRLCSRDEEELEEERESDRDSAVGSTQGSDSSEGPARPGDKEDSLGEGSAGVTSDLSTRSSASLYEEQFEDYGVGEEPDYTPSSPSAEDESRTHIYSDLGSSVPSSAGQTPRKVRHLCPGDQMDVYCSQCCKKVNLLNDLDARLKNLKSNSPNRKISSTAFGRQLLQHSNLSSSHGSTEDLFRDSIDSCDLDINEKVGFLEKKVAELENDSLLSADLKSKLKQENTQLVHRVNELEEQLKDQEAQAELNMEEEGRRHREAFSKMERDTNTHIELLNNRVQQLEEENSHMSSGMCRLKSQTEKLDEEKQRMTDKLEDTSLRLKDEMDLYRKMMDKLRQNRHQFQKEKEAMQELIEDLRRELEHLQLYQLETERPGGRGSASGLVDFTSRTREVELEHEVKRLKQENQRLREQSEELNGQLLSLSLFEAKSLFASQSKAQSLAAEIDNASRDQLIKAIKEQEDINFRLRQYMDKIILSILDHNPSILEIKK
uniref:RAB11 family interacting protein 4 (class II) b n=1 Tax=Gadus morhua TaxID=8049 RepID=A0A8C5A8D4_GADMO